MCSYTLVCSLLSVPSYVAFKIFRIIVFFKTFLVLYCKAPYDCIFERMSLKSESKTNTNVLEWAKEE